MKVNPILSVEEFSKRYQKLTKPFYKANLSLMYDLLDDQVFQTIVKEARGELGILSNGRRPNKPETYLRFIEKNKCVYSIHLYTTTLKERNILYNYINKLTSYNGLEHFKDAFAIYIVHNLISAPEHNIKLSFRILGNGKILPPFFSAGRVPSGNDLAIMKLLLQNSHINRNFISRLPNMFKKSYRGKKDLDKHLKVTNLASDRRRTDEADSKSYDITNAEISYDVYRTIKKKDAVRKRLSRHRDRKQELTSR